MKTFSPKNFKFHEQIKKCHFGNFSDRAGMAWHCQCGPQESLTGFQKFFLLLVPMISQHCWKAKLKSAHFLKVQSGKTTVCCGHKRLRRQRTPKAHCVFWQPISLIVFLQPFLLTLFLVKKPKQIVDRFIRNLN